MHICNKFNTGNYERYQSCAEGDISYLQHSDDSVHSTVQYRRVVQCTRNSPRDVMNPRHHPSCPPLVAALVEKRLERRYRPLLDLLAKNPFLQNLNQGSPPEGSRAKTKQDDERTYRHTQLITVRDCAITIFSKRFRVNIVAINQNLVFLSI